jgi:ABC-type antimicrobial peptide transport system permease subunit
VFQLAYTFQELRRRLGRTVLTALGLALGVGLVIGIIGVSQGLDDAQGDVLAPLRSVGTDILVTRVTGTTTAADGSTTTTTAPNGQLAGPGGAPQGGPGGGFFAGRGGEGQQNREDTQALLSENQSVITDLSKLGNPGDKFTHDFFLSATLQSFPASAVTKIEKVDGVETAVGGLVQLAEHQTGTVPQIVASIQTGGQTFEQTVRPDPMTDAERAAFRACLEAKGVTVGPQAGGGTGGPPAGDGGGFGGGGGGFRSNPAFDDCLPARFKEFRATFTTPLQTIQQVVNPPSTDITSTSYTAAAVDPAQPEVGLVTQDQLTSGRWLMERAPNEILVNVAYANTKGLKVGGTIPINGTDYKIVGLVRPTLTGSTADVYFPLATLQKLATKENRVTQVLVKATDADSVDTVAASIKKQLPGAEVVTTKGLADQVTGSLADAHELSGRLGTALAIIVLAAAFIIAVLLTLASISKRVREIGTLRAIGWSKGRVVRQLLTETIGIGLLGGILGIGVGVVVVALINALSPSLSATTAGVPGLNGSNLAGVFGQTTTAVRTTNVSLHAVLSPATLALGVVFALVGGVLAGLVGGWRAARLSPVVALRDLG